MEQIKSLISGEAEGSGTSRYESIQRCIQSLVHACQCRDANCRRMSCHKMKRVVQHTKMCKKRVNASCPVCKQLIALCCYHAKHCNREPCTVPFCMNIRQKLAEQKRVSTRRAEKMMRRRMEVLHAGVGGPSSSNPALSGTSSANSNAPTPPAAKPMSMGGGQKGGNGMTTPMSAGPPSTPGGSMMQPGSVGGPPSSMMQQQSQQQQRPPGYGNPMMQQQPGMQGMQLQPGPQQPGQQQQNRYGQPGLQSGMQNMLPGPGQMMQNQQMRPGAPGGVQGPGVSGAPGMQPRPGQMQPPPYRAANPSQMPQGGYPAGGMNPMMSQQQQMMMRPPGAGPQGPPGAAGQQGQIQGMPSDRSMQQQLAQIEMRLKQTKSDEEREQLCAELKKTPHLFSAFLKLTRAHQQDQGQHNMYQQYQYRPMTAGPQYGNQMMPGQPRPAPGHAGWQQPPQQGYSQRPMQNPSGQQFGQMQGRGLSPSMNPNMGPGGQQMMGQQQPGQQGQPQPQMMQQPDQPQFR